MILPFLVFRRMNIVGEMIRLSATQMEKIEHNNAVSCRDKAKVDQ
jgi:hypothetical protein